MCQPKINEYDDDDELLYPATMDRTGVGEGETGKGRQSLELRFHRLAVVSYAVKFC